MKKLLSIISISLCSIFIYSQNDLIVFAEDPIPFYLVINGVKQNNKAETNVKLPELNNDRISLKVIFEDESINPISKDIWLKGELEGEDINNMIITYRIVKTKKAYKLRWHDQVSKNNAPKTNNNQSTVIYKTVEAPPTKTTVKETVTTTTSTDNVDNANVNVNMGGSGVNMSVNVSENSNQPTQETNSDNVSFNMSVNINDNTEYEENANVSMDVNVNDNWEDDEWADNENANINMNMNVNENMDYGDNVETTSYSSTTTTTTTTTSYGGDTYTESNTTTTNSGWDNNNNNIGNTSSSNSSNGCEVQNMNSILNAIENESFKSDKMMVAEQSTKKKCLSVNQIKMVMDKFTYEDSKLEFAKMAYVNCPNKDDYYQINESFTYSSSKSELNEFINNQ